MSFKRKIAGWLRSYAALRWILTAGILLIVPRRRIGVAGVVLDDQGRVLLVEHVFRNDFAWGLPGGWAGRREDPADALRREIEEELGIPVVVERILACEEQPRIPRQIAPHALALAYLCRPRSTEPVGVSAEVLSSEWVKPEGIRWTILPFHRTAIELATSR